ncbi:MAG: hypothetical protein UR97_C0007G0025 [Candidatus Nomurabacteria bacterium GW2011_GWE2_36_115]|nr:MAG: hypothetical protein UR97_C0007G0025 [Candidatus Nomurabacteria bacterium GW2011_GWE2_36_115]
MKQSRLDQLSDGIFAIVTGLVTEQHLLNTLVEMAPLFLSYLLSFSLLFTYWRSHHLIASVLAKNIDTKFSNLNGIFLFFVALVPFSSRFLGQYANSETAIIFFALNIILIGTTLFKMRNYVIKSGTIENVPFTKKENEHANMHILFPVGSAIMAIAVSFFSNSLALSLFTVAILFNLSGNGIKVTFFIIDLFRKN